MKKKIITGAAIIALIAGSVVAYAQTDSVTPTPSVNPSPSTIEQPIAPSKESKIALTGDEYRAMMDIVRKVDAGELPDEELVKAERLIKRSLQDLNDPEGSYSANRVKPEDRERVLAKWQGLADRLAKANP